MKVLTFAVFVILSTSLFANDSGPSFTCYAEIRDNMETGENSVKKRALIHVSTKSTHPIIRRFNIKLDHFSFSVTEDITSNSLFLMITKAPDYEKGLVGQGSLDQDGHLQITQLDGPRSRSLTCELK